MMKDGTMDMTEDGQAHWLHFSVRVHADSPTTAEEIADVITGEVGVEAVHQLTNDGFGRLSRKAGPPLAQPREDDFGL